MQRLHLGPLAAWYHPAKNPRGSLLLIHGLSEHSGRHLNTVAALVEAGLNVLRFDLRGSGKSGGRRQYIERFDEYVEDANTAFNWLTREAGPAPYFALGHSLGGAIAIRFAVLRRQLLSGLVLSAPAYRLGGSISPVKISLGRLVARIAPTVELPGGDPADVSRDPAAVEAYRTDPLSHRRNTVSQGKAILDALPSTPEIFDKITCPVLFAHGSADRIIRIEGSFELFRRAPAVDKCFFVNPGGYHEPHNDYGKEEYFSFLVHWLERRIAEHRNAPSPELTADRTINI